MECKLGIDEIVAHQDEQELFRRQQVEEERRLRRQHQDRQFSASIAKLKQESDLKYVSVDTAGAALTSENGGSATSRSSSSKRIGKSASP